MTSRVKFVFVVRQKTTVGLLPRVTLMTIAIASIGEELGALISEIESTV